MTEAALLAAVLADPDDDAPRLILADFWEENGQDERAEFVRVQCRITFLESIEGGKHDERGAAACHLCDQLRGLRRRERELLDANFGTWTDGLPEPLVMRQCPSCEDGVADYETNVIECRRCDCTGLVPDQDRVEFRRGFVAAVTCTAADWLEHGDAILAAQPVEEVTLTTWPGVRELVMMWEGKGMPRAGEVDDTDPWVDMLKACWGRVRHWHLPPPDLHRAFLTATRQIIRDTGGVVQSNVPRIT